MGCHVPETWPVRRPGRKHKSGQGSRLRHAAWQPGSGVICESSGVWHSADSLVKRNVVPMNRRAHDTARPAERHECLCGFVFRTARLGITTALPASSATVVSAFEGRRQGMAAEDQRALSPQLPGTHHRGSNVPRGLPVRGSSRLALDSFQVSDSRTHVVSQNSAALCFIQ